jgi:hypothetical protein
VVNDHICKIQGGGTQALVRGLGGFSTKVHLRAEGGGKPITWVLTAGHRHEAPQITPLLDRGAIRRPGRGRPRLRPPRVAGAKVAARITFRAMHEGEFQGIPPTGQQVTFSSIELNRMEGGKVAEHWVELDLLGRLQQLGAIPSAGS